MVGRVSGEGWMVSRGGRVVGREGKWGREGGRDGG